MSEEETQYIEFNGKKLPLPPTQSSSEEMKKAFEQWHAKLQIQEASKNIETTHEGWKILAEDPDYPGAKIYETPNGIYAGKPGNKEDIEQITQVAPTESIDSYKARQNLRYNKGE